MSSEETANEMPEGLDELGKAAHAAVMKVAEKHEATYTGGGRTFYSPAEWEDRGEKCGTESKLIVVYDGGDIRRVAEFGGRINEELIAELAKSGLFIEECTNWYSAVYEINPAPKPKVEMETAADEEPFEGPFVVIPPDGVYRPAHVTSQAFVAAVDAAKVFWAKRCAETIAQKGDYGTCVLGAGLVVNYLAKGKRKPRDLKIISAHDVTNAQGSCVWETSYREAIAFLAGRGIIATYEAGNMD